LVNKYKSYWRDKFSALLDWRPDPEYLFVIGILVYVGIVPVFLGVCVELFLPSPKEFPLFNGFVTAVCGFAFTLTSLLFYIDWDEWKTHKGWYDEQKRLEEVEKSE